MHRILLTCILAGACIVPALAQTPSTSQAADSAHIRDLESVVVRGVQPGPGLWKVSKGDHVLWILGTLTPLPRNMTWNSRHVEAVIATAQEVVNGPEAAVKSNASWFATLTVLPALIGLRNNPDGKRLKDVVPFDLYARWVPLKQKYIGGSDKVESWRPIFAALELYDAAIRRTGLSDQHIVEKAVDRAAKRAGVKVTTPSVAVTVDSPRAAVKEFKTAELDDIDCFRKTLDRIDIDLATMTARANAWSTGDLGALRKLPYADQMSVCQAAVSGAGFTQTHGLNGISARAHQAWLDAATSALEKNKVTFATLPIARLLNEDAYLSRLRAMGYAIEEPAMTPDNAVAPKSVSHSVSQ
jgi:hypothetical protein